MNSAQRNVTAAHGMFEGFTAADAEDVRFLLVCRDLTDGRTALVLHLYRDEKLASKTTISVAEDGIARMMLLLSRMHLFKLGLREHSPRLPRAAGLQLAAKAA